MGNEIKNSTNNLFFRNTSKIPTTNDEKNTTLTPRFWEQPITEANSTKTTDFNIYGNYYKNKIANNFNQNKVDYELRTQKLNEIFSRRGFSSYKEIAPFISDLSKEEIAKLKEVYQQKTGRSLLMDASNWLLMEDKLKTFRIIAPERIKTQTEPQETGAGINMNPPAKEVPIGSEVQFSLNLSNQAGNPKVKHLINGENGDIVKEGNSFKGYFPDDKTRLVLFEVRYDGQPSEFYEYRQAAVDANVKAENELSKLPGTAPEAEVYQQYLDLRIEEAKGLLEQLEAKRADLQRELQQGSRNSATIYTELRQVEKQIEQVKAGLAEFETAKTEMDKAFSDSVGKPIPLQAVLVARENGQSIPLQLYAKDLGGGKWAIVDMTNPAKPRSYVGEGILPADALNQAWKNFTTSTNDLPAGQIAVVKPQGLGFSGENRTWNAFNDGRSWSKWTADGLGKGSLILAGAGIVALLIPGGQGVGVGLLLASGVTGGISSGFNAADRINNGTFKFRDSETALDLLGVFGGLVSAGGLASLTKAGAKGISLLTQAGKFKFDVVGKFTRITQYAEQGTNVLGVILINNQSASALEQVQKSNASPEEKASQTRQIINSAIATGAFLIVGNVLFRKFKPPTESELNVLLKKSKLPTELENLVKTDLRVQKVFVNDGKEALAEVYDDFLRGGKTGNGLKVKDFGEYLGRRQFSTSLDKSTDSVAEVIGADNFSRMKPEQINQRIVELTNPELFQNYKNLPKHIRESIDQTLKENHNIGSSIQFSTANQKLNKKLYENIGREIRDLNEFKRVLSLIGNSSAQGSIGNGFAQRNLIQGNTIKEFNYSSELWTGKPSTKRRADNLLITERSTLDIKTGYKEGYPNSKNEIAQMNDYNKAVKASQDPANVKFRTYLADNDVKGGELKSHDYLFLTNGRTSAESSARKSFQKIESKLLETDQKNFRVFFQADDGKIYQIVRNQDEQIEIKLIGNKLPN